MLLGEQKFPPITLYVETVIGWFEASGGESHQQHRMELIRLSSRSINTDIRILLCLRSKKTQKSFPVINSFSDLKINALDTVLVARPHAKTRINSQLLISAHAGVKCTESFCSRTTAIWKTNLGVVLQDPCCITFDWLDLESHSFFLSSDPIATLNLARLRLQTSDIPATQIHQTSDYTL